MCDDGDCELYRRSMIEICLTETGFVRAMGLLLLGSSSSSSSGFFFFCIYFCTLYGTRALETRVPRGLFIHISLELECLRLEFLH